jgi:hypothetical protein
MGIKISDMPDLTGSKLNDNSLLLITDLSGSTLDLQNRKVKNSTFSQIFSNNKLLDGLSSYENFFGSGEDGDFTFSSNTNITSDNHGEIVVKQYKTCVINLGATVTTSNPCRGLVFLCTGDLTVDGTLTMTGKGGGVGNKSTEFNYNIADTSLSFNTSSNGGSGVQSWNFSPSGSVWYPRYRQNIPIRNPVVGVSQNVNGIAGIFSCGGGGGGVTGFGSCPTGGASGGQGGIGGSGSLFAGGGGGGGGAGNYCYSGGAGDNAIFEIGGRGGSSGVSGGGGGGGAGSAAGAAGSGAAGGPSGGVGGTGVGGLLIIIVRGNVTITGTISSNGLNGGGGGGSASPGSSAGGTGGSSGGGRLIIVYGGTYSNTGTVQANGGAVGSGTSGGAGVITIQKIDQ